MELRLSSSVLRGVQDAVAEAAYSGRAGGAISIRKLQELRVGNYEELILALLHLRKMKLVRAEASVRCPNCERETWVCDPEEVGDNLWRLCVECSSPEPPEMEGVRFRFFIESDHWLQREGSVHLPPP